VTKTCTKCGEIKPTGEFPLRKNRKGEKVPRPVCKRCFNEAERSNPDRRAKAYARQKVGPSGIRVTRQRDAAPPPPMPTAQEISEWYHKGCPIRTAEKVAA
jgi:hypothetical protein